MSTFPDVTSPNGLTIEQLVEVSEAQTGLVLGSEAYYVTETPTGLVFDEETPLDVWAQLTMRLIRQHKKLEWAIADAINFGGRRYGETYAQWVDETGLSENTLANIAWVGRQVESSRRREDVDFCFYREVASLDPDDQERLIDLAVDNGMKRYELRQAVKAEKEAIKADVLPAASTPVCAADESAWMPGKEDLLPEHRIALEMAALESDLSDPTGFTAGYLRALVDTRQEACFLPGRWRE